MFTSLISLVRIFWLFVIISVAATVIFTVWFAYNTYQAQSKVILSSLESEALRFSRTWLDDIGYVSYQMEVLGKQIKENDPQDLKGIRTILSYSKVEHRINNSITWNMFSWADADHQIKVDAELGVLHIPKDISTRDYIPWTKEEPWKIHLGKPVFGAVSRQWLIPAGSTKLARLGKAAEESVDATKAAKKADNLWTAKEVGGRKVYQRDDLIDPNRVDRYGKTNLERMQEGKAPIGSDGKPMELHHMTQQEVVGSTGNRGTLAEVESTFHQQNTGTLHINSGPSFRNDRVQRPDGSRVNVPSQQNREFNQYRNDYWQQRSNDFMR